MIENIISTAVKDDEAFYLRFLEDTFPYMDNYTYTDGMQQITAEMEEILRSRPSDPKDHALLLLYRARLSSDSKKAISYLEEALRLLPETDAGNAALKGNLHATFGELFRKCHDVISARRHMDTAASIFRSFGLENTHDFMTFYINRSYFLLQTGSPREALENLLWLEQRMMGQNLYSVDYMLLQETLLYAYDCSSHDNIFRITQIKLFVCSKHNRFNPELMKSVFSVATLFIPWPSSKSMNECSHR